LSGNSEFVKNITEARGTAEASPTHLCLIIISSVDIPNNIHLNFSDFLKYSFNF
jgi:hypothetical protein